MSQIRPYFGGLIWKGIKIYLQLASPIMFYKILTFKFLLQQSYLHICHGNKLFLLLSYLLIQHFNGLGDFSRLYKTVLGHFLQFSRLDNHRCLQTTHLATLLHMLPKPWYLTTYVGTYVVRYLGFGNICRDICWQNIPPNICRDMCRVMCCHNRHLLVQATYVWFPQHKSSFETHVGTCASQNSYARLGYIRLKCRLYYISF